MAAFELKVRSTEPGSPVLLTAHTRSEADVAPPGKPTSATAEGCMFRLLSLNSIKSPSSNADGFEIRTLFTFALAELLWLRPLALSLPIPKILFLKPAKVEAFQTTVPFELV